MDKSNLNTRNKKCANCGDVPKGKVVKGLCPACRIFYRRNGRHRTKADMIRQPGDPVPLCKNCKQSRVGHYRHLCNACYQYRRLNGVDRPSHRWRTECKICGRPREKGFAKGRCPICYNYRRKYRRDRSSEWIEELYPMGWCDCGQVATQEIEVGVGLGGPQPLKGVVRIEKLSVCDECAETENEFASLTI